MSFHLLPSLVEINTTIYSMLPLLFFLLLFLPIVQPKFNLYHTEPTLDIDRLQVSCLHYHNSFGIDGIEKSEFCLGSIEENSFDDVDLLHITEKYAFYTSLISLCNLSTIFF